MTEFMNKPEEKVWTEENIRRDRQDMLTVLVMCITEGSDPLFEFK